MELDQNFATWMIAGGRRTESSPSFATSVRWQPITWSETEAPVSRSVGFVDWLTGLLPGSQKDGAQSGADARS